MFIREKSAHGSDFMMRLDCPACKQPMLVPPTAGGGIVTCPKCGQQMRVAPAPPLPPIAPPLAEIPTLEEAPPSRENVRADLGDLEAPTILRRKADQSLLDELPKGTSEEALRLGAPFAFFWPSGRESTDRLKPAAFLGFFTLVVGVIAVGIPIHFSLVWKLLSWVIFFAFLAGAISCVVLAILATVRANEVLCCPEGLIRILGNRVTVWPWDEVTEVTFYIVHVVNQYGRHLRTTHHYSVQLADERVLILNDYLEHVKALGSHILAETTRRLLPKMRARLAAGEKLTFGPFALDQKTFSARGRLAWWADVVVCTPFEGSVRVRL